MPLRHAGVGIAEPGEPDVERLADGHVRRRDQAALGHLHRDVVAHGVDLGQAERAQRDQLAHPLVPRPHQHLDVVERDAVDRQEVLQVPADQLGDLVDPLVDLLKRRDLDDLVDGLLDDRAGVLVQRLGGKTCPAYGMWVTSLTASSLLSTCT